jgi:hypothetical protein
MPTDRHSENHFTLSPPLPLSGFLRPLRTHLGATYLSSAAFFIALPLSAPTLPRSPNAFRRRVCLTLCANIPRPAQRLRCHLFSLRRPSTTLLVLLSLGHSTASPIHGPSLFTPPYATLVAAAAAYSCFSLCSLLLPSIAFQFVARPL